MKRIRTSIITAFIILSTILAIFFQWAEFYKGYSYDSFNLFCSIIFFIEWILISFYFGRTKNRKYFNIILVYWGNGIIVSLIICFLIKLKMVMKLIFPFYVWYGAPLYGFRYAILVIFRFSIDIPALMLLTVSLIMIGNLIGYWIGKLQK